MDDILKKFALRVSEILLFCFYASILHTRLLLISLNGVSENLTFIEGFPNVKTSGKCYVNTTRLFLDKFSMPALIFRRDCLLALCNKLGFLLQCWLMARHLVMPIINDLLKSVRSGSKSYG